MTEHVLSLRYEAADEQQAEDIAYVLRALLPRLLEHPPPHGLSRPVVAAPRLVWRGREEYAV